MMNQATIYVGRNIGGRPTLSEDAVIDAYEALAAPYGLTSATFSSAQGVWRSPETGKVERERSVRIELLSDSQTFERDVNAIAAGLAAELRQEAVLVSVATANATFATPVQVAA